MSDTAPSRSDLRRYVDAGLIDSAIAVLYGVNRGTILRWRHQDGIEPNWGRGQAHGTVYMYSTKGCRCRPCTDAVAERATRDRAARFARCAAEGLPDGVEHGLSAARNWGCKCTVCATARNVENKKLSMRAQAGLIEHVRGGRHQNCPCEPCRAYAAKLAKSRNDPSRETARRQHYVWTGPELEIASRSDLTARQMAEMLGRSIAAVRQQRHRLYKADPKTVYLLGAPRGSK